MTAPVFLPLQAAAGYDGRRFIGIQTPYGQLYCFRIPVFCMIVNPKRNSDVLSFYTAVYIHAAARSGQFAFNGK